MADILLDVESTPVTPAAGQAVLYFDNVSKKLTSKNDAGVVLTAGDIVNASSVAVAGGYAADTYLAGAQVVVPNGLFKPNSIYRAIFDMTKTAAGVAAPTAIIRVGTAGTVADAARITFTFGAGTAAIDTGIFEIWAHFRNVGAAAVLVAGCRCVHSLAATGLTSTGASGCAIILANSAAFDSTVPNSIIGVSFNGGAAFAGTNTFVQSGLDNV